MEILVLIIGLAWLWVGIGGMIRTGRPQYSRFANTNEKSRGWLRRGIQGAKEEVWIVSGNFNPGVYNRSLVDDLRAKISANPKVNIHMLSGPEILTLEGKNEVVELAREIAADPNDSKKCLAISFLNRRPSRHFRILDKTTLYLEDAHAVDERQRWASVVENSFFKAWQYRCAFKKMWREGEHVPLAQLKFTPIDNGGNP